MDIAQLFDLLPHMRVYDLEQPRYFGAPIHPSHAPGYMYTLHRHHEAGMGEARTGASGFFYSADHAGTHIDALVHQAENLTLYEGITITPQLQTSTGFTEMGVETIPPLLTRGVLLDVATHRGVDCIQEIITRDELQEVAQQQQVSIREGDIVLVRTGNGARWSDPETYLATPGIDSAASWWLAGLHVRAVGADHMSWDTMGVIDPELNVSLPGHIIFLVRHGIYILENLYLEELARQKLYEFVFVCLPLKMRGATGSPVRPIALAP